MRITSRGQTDWNRIGSSLNKLLRQKIKLYLLRLIVNIVMMSTMDLDLEEWMGRTQTTSFTPYRDMEEPRI